MVRYQRGTPFSSCPRCIIATQPIEATHLFEGVDVVVAQFAPVVLVLGDHPAGVSPYNITNSSLPWTYSHQVLGLVQSCLARAQHALFFGLFPLNRTKLHKLHNQLNSNIQVLTSPLPTCPLHPPRPRLHGLYQTSTHASQASRDPPPSSHVTTLSRPRDYLHLSPAMSVSKSFADVISHFKVRVAEAGSPVDVVLEPEVGLANKLHEICVAE